MTRFGEVRHDECATGPSFIAYLAVDFICKNDITN